MKSQLYRNKVSTIIKESIKSAVFIDEKAVEFFTTEPNLKIIEEKLSVNLYKNFKAAGVSFSINKFDKSIKRDKNYFNFLFKKKDLILLDWKLDGEEGIEYSLELLSKVIETNHLHFCTIYTSETNHEIIFNNLRSYFSGYSKDDYEKIKQELEVYGKDLEKIVDQVTFNPIENNHLVQELTKLDSGLIALINNLTNCKDVTIALVSVKLSFTNFCKPKKPIKIPLFLNIENEAINLNNTIISIINKEDDSPEKILAKLTDQVVASPNSFIEILGLDMQNKFYENSSFINPHILNVSFDALLYHRKQLIETVSEEEFKDFVLSILLEQSKMTLQISNLNTLDTSFLNEETKEIGTVSNEEICLLNTFYNGSVLEKDKLNFGDILVDSNTQTYYLCITPLCDCLHPKNIKSNFYFVTGIKSNIEKSINTGDSGFKSFINESTCIGWTESDYIKPFQIHIANSNFKGNELNSKLFKDDEVNELKLRYVFSLKNSYAQRIANHAFNYPIRVGVDFVKRDKKEL